MSKNSIADDTPQLSPNADQNPHAAIYQASPLKRHRATQTEMEERAAFLIDYAKRHGPMTVRGLFYQATVAGVPGIDKSEAGYAKVQAQVLNLRRAGHLPYWAIADATRYMRKPASFDGWEDALNETARVYRKSLWADRTEQVEIWVEKSALVGVLYPVTREFDVPLMPTGGFTSETFAHSAVASARSNDRDLTAYALYDFDRSGQDAAASLEEKLHRFGEEMDVGIDFHLLGLEAHQVIDWGLPTRPHKRTTKADQRWPYDFACELDAVAPHDLRRLVQDAIELHLPSDELARLKEIEAAERDTLIQFVGGA